MPFEDITKAENKMYYDDGFIEGRLLEQKRRIFLEKITLEDMQRKKCRMDYIKLFNV
jgi:hypothetical protein